MGDNKPSNDNFETLSVKLLLEIVTNSIDAYKHLVSEYRLVATSSRPIGGFYKNKDDDIHK